MGKKKPAEPPNFRLGFLVHDVSRLRRTVVDKALKPLDITRSQWWVLANLSRMQGGGMMQTELAALLDIGKVALGGLLDRLEANGYIVRRNDKADRRAKRVLMTARGAALLEKAQVIAAVLNKEMIRGMPPRLIAQTEDALHDMKLRLIEMESRMKDNDGLADFTAPASGEGVGGKEAGGKGAGVSGAR